MKWLGLDSQEQDGDYLAEFNKQCSLTRTQRLIGFGVCFILGWVITLMSCFAIPSIVTKPQTFAILYTFGNIVSLCSTCFLWGPVSQIKQMFKPIRIGATIIYLLAMSLTLFCAFQVKMAWPVILSMIVQMLAMIWYCASYVPYGRQMLTGCLKGACNV